MLSAPNQPSLPDHDVSEGASRGFFALGGKIIAYWARVAASLNHPRLAGWIFGRAFVPERSVTADDLGEHLGVSRSEAGRGIKILIDIGTLRLVHNIAGHREHFQAQGDLGMLVRRSLNVRVFPALEELRLRSETPAASGGIRLPRRLAKPQHWQRRAFPLMPLLKPLAA